MHYSHKKITRLSGIKKLPYVFLLGLTGFLIFRYLLWWLQPTHFPSNETLVGPFASLVNGLLFAALTFVIFLGFVIRIASWYAAWFMAKPYPVKPESGMRVAFLTCYVPGREPLNMLRGTLQSITAVKYPHDTWVLDEGNNQNVQALCQEMGVKYFTRYGSRRFSKGICKKGTKAGNLNSWRKKHEDKYDVVAQVDMDHRPKADYLLKTLGYFADPKVGFIGMPQVYKNTSNWIAKGASEQTHFFYGPIQQGFYGKDMAFLIGTSHVYRTKAMKEINGYSPTIAEDHLTGLNLHSNGWKSVYVSEVLAEGDGPLSWSDYFGQQMRWSYGLFEILFRYSPRLVFKLSRKQRFHYLLSQIFYFSGVSYLIGSLLTIVYLAFGLSSTSVIFSDWIWYSLPPFIMCYVLQLYLHQFQLNPKNESRFGLHGMLLGIGANIIYAMAFMRFLGGKKLHYKVTTKGADSGAIISDISTFKPHIIVAALMMISLIVSMVEGNESGIIRFWAITNIASTAVIVGSNYFYYIKVMSKSLIDSFFRPFIFTIPRMQSM